MSEKRNDGREDPFTLVLGGGGIAGIAWTTGLLLGLAERGVRLEHAEHVIGTSAGAVVGAQLLGETGLDALFARQSDPAQQTVEPVPDPISVQSAGRFMPLLRAQMPMRAAHVADFLDHPPLVSPEERRAIVAARLRVQDWPDRRLEITAVDLETGALQVFDREAGTRLVDAVTASCALPGIWPAVTIGGRRYVDGGVRSAENADLAAGARAVVILSPNGVGSDPERALANQIAALEAGGTRVLLIEPDSPARACMRNLLDPAARGAAAEAGRAQGRTEAARF
jgi:NTE family protein